MHKSGHLSEKTLHYLSLIMKKYNHYKEDT